MLGKLTGQDEAHGGLDLARGDRGLLGVGGELCRTKDASESDEEEWAEVNALDASVAMRSKISFTNEFKMAIALFEIPVSGWTCLRTYRVRCQTKSISLRNRSNSPL